MSLPSAILSHAMFQPRVVVVVAAAAGRTTKFPGLQMSASAFWLRATGSPLGEYPYRTTAMGGMAKSTIIVIFRSLSTLAIFFTGLAKFDFGHCGFFALGLWIALFGIRSRYVPTMSRLCKILLFIVYALNFPWVDDPGMWTKSFGVTSINACEDTELFRYTWRTFGWPLLAVIATTCWSKAVD